MGSVSPATVGFTIKHGGTADGQMVRVSSGTATKVDDSLTSTALTGGDWLVMTPASGLLPGPFKVFVRATKLAAGVYTGTITLRAASSANAPVTVPVTLTVQ